MTEEKVGGRYYQTEMAKFLRSAIDAVAAHKSQREISKEIGCKSPNMVSMMKMGDTKVPIDRIPALAVSLDVDPGYLLQLWLDQNISDVENEEVRERMRTVHKLFTNSTLTQTERRILDLWRKKAPQDIQGGLVPMPQNFWSELARSFASLWDGALQNR